MGTWVARPVLENLAAYLKKLSQSPEVQAGQTMPGYAAHLRALQEQGRPPEKT